MSEQEACPTNSQFHPEHKHHERYCKSSSNFRDTQQTTGKAKSKLFVLQDMTIPNAQKGAGNCRHIYLQKCTPRNATVVTVVSSPGVWLSTRPNHKREAHLGRHVQWGHTIQIYVVDIGIWVALICWKVKKKLLKNLGCRKRKPTTSDHNSSGNLWEGILEWWATPGHSYGLGPIQIWKHIIWETIFIGIFEATTIIKF